MPSGIVIVDKPAGWTSMDVCAKLRGVFQERRIGHGGTLDPMATGVLPVFAGQATRAAAFAESGEKEYVLGLRLGVVTDTQDTTGTVLETRSVTVPDGAVAEVLERFVGEVEQIPPMYSAVKVGGQRLYALARRGAEVERKPRPVRIFALTLLEQCSPTDYQIRCRCSKGTYIRTLCHDIGALLGCGGAMYALRRTEAAGYTLEQALTLEEIQARGAGALLPVETMFLHLPLFTPPSPGKEQRIRNGNPVTADLPDGTYRIRGRDGAFLCISQARGGTLRPVKTFFGA